MKILLVDDSATIRAMLRRALHELPSVEVAEAANGLEALAEIARHRCDLVILDVKMPVMSGLEALEAIRSSPAHAALPVVVFTSERADAVVRRLVQLGVTDYLSKPLGSDRLTERLSTIVERLRAPLPTHRRGPAAGRNLRVLVVELDPDRRHFVTTVLAPHYAVVAVDSAASALHVCLDPQAPPVDVVVVGEQVGLPPLAMFMSRLRTLPNTKDTRVIGYRSRSGGEAERSRGLVDDMVEWAYVPEVFLARFDRAVHRTDDAASAMSRVRMTLERDAMCATQQLFGLMLSSEVARVEAGTAPIRQWPGTGIHARIDLRIDDGSALSVLFRADAESAKAVTAGLMGLEPGVVIEDDIAATAGEFANIIAGRLRNRLIEEGIETPMRLPQTWFGASPTDCEMPDIALEFDLRALGASFGVVLRVGELVSAGACSEQESAILACA